MRLFVSSGLAALGLALAASVASAQQPGYYGRTTVSRAQVRLERERNDLTPYRSRTTGVSARGEYRRAQPEPPARREPPRAEPVRRNYFPGLPVGNGANRNVVDTGRLCVPGRRAFLAGR